MANSVFGTDTGKPVVVRTGKAIITINGATMLAINAQIQFGRTVEVINTIGDKRVISIGEAQGSFSAETILSKDYDIAEAMHLNEGGCDTFTMSVTFGGSTCNIYGKTLTCHNCVASAVSLSVQGGRGFIGQGVQAVFTGLTM